ncbi:hypothetical protein BKA60DRAFT_583263 [Fusarium oxysporum]|nr:hypothetical protein BKA60DRAFT_583263 [Fusarium oxysporum]
MMTEPSEPYYIMLKPVSWPYNNEILNLLGRIVKNFYSPFDQYTPDTSGQYPSRRLIVHGPLKDFKLSTESCHERRAQGQVGPIAQFQKGFSDTVMTELAGKSVWAVRLQQLGDFFEAITSDVAIRNKLHGWLKPFTSDQAYFIAGVLVAEDISITQRLNTSKDASLNINAPVSTMAQLAAGSPFTIPIGDSSASGSKCDSLLKNLSGRVEGLRIIAVDYRIVCRYWFGRDVVLTDQNPGAKLARKFGGGNDDELVLGRREIGKLGLDVYRAVFAQSPEDTYRSKRIEDIHNKSAPALNDMSAVAQDFTEGPKEEEDQAEEHRSEM